MFNYSIDVSNANAEEINKRTESVYSIPSLKEDIGEIKDDLNTISEQVYQIRLHQTGLPPRDNNP